MNALLKKIKRDARARRCARQLLAVAPHLDDPKYRPLVLSFGEITVMSLDAAKVLHEQGILDENGDLRRGLNTFAQLVSIQSKLGAQLGLTPSTFAALNRAKPSDLEATYARIEKAHAARHANENEIEDVEEPEGT